MGVKIPYRPQDAFSVFENTMVEMTWQEIQSEADQNAIVLLPIGTIESHGPHLDLSADFYLSTLFCRFLKQELNKLAINALISPPFYWGVSNDVAKYAGTFSIRPETMKEILIDIMASLRSWGFKRVFISNAHGDHIHIETIMKVIDEVNELPAFCAYALWDLNIEVNNNIQFPQMRQDRYQPDYHAGAIETAQMATFFPEKVRYNIVKNLTPQDSFHPFAYCGDPASYDLEYNIKEFTMVDVALDALKIEAVLKRDGKKE